MKQAFYGIALVSLAFSELPVADAETLSACAQKATGALRLAAKCKKSEKALVLNTEGLQGLVGVAGIQGPQGPKGDTGPAGPQGAEGRRWRVWRGRWDQGL